MLRPSYITSHNRGLPLLMQGPVIEGVVLMVTRQMNLVYGVCMLLGAAYGGYGWFVGEMSEARNLFFVGVLGSLLFFWKAKKRDNE